ncbi:MAG: RnfABCDGE type electron transport complex subunit D, partial [Elusimicrobia bacterium]|nr:RnfABCDGE type electron transport complex subunit D [Elusimicrobiota bacterium]
PLAAIASKFLIRWNDKHLFNPTNFAVVLLLLATEHAWVTPSQWGTSVLLGAWIAILGVTVAARAGRSDVSWTFLACFLGLKLLRATSLGQGPETVLPLLKSGALLLFTFFMINDPRTTPNASRARVLFAVTTAVLAFAWGDLHGGNNAPFYALLVMTPLTPLMDKRWKGPKHVWTPAPEAVPAR